MTIGWQEVPLGKVLKRADRFEKKDELQAYHFAGTYSFARGIFAGAIKEGSAFGLDKIQRIKKGDFIYCKIMAWEGAFGIASDKVDDCVMSGAFVAYEVDKTQIYPKFLDYYFKQERVWKSIGSQSTGTNVRRRSLHPDQFEKAIIPFPPLDEQRRIVERVEALSACIEKAQSLRKASDAESNILLDTALRRAYDQAVQISGKTERLNDLCTTITDGTHVTPTYMDEGIPFLSVKDISSGAISFVGTRLISPEEHAYLTKRCKPERDDILLTKVGTTGIAKVVDVDREFSIFVSIALLKLDKTRLNPKFTEYMLNSPVLKQHSSDGTRGVGNKNLVLKFIKEFPMPVPRLNEQRRIVAYLDSVQARLASLRELQSQTQEELDVLLPSILDKAFKGEL